MKMLRMNPEDEVEFEPNRKEKLSMEKRSKDLSTIY